MLRRRSRARDNPGAPSHPDSISDKFTFGLTLNCKNKKILNYFKYKDLKLF